MRRCLFMASLVAGCTAAPARPRLSPDAALADAASGRDAAMTVDASEEVVGAAEDAAPDASVEEDSGPAEPGMLTSNGCAGGACLNPGCVALGTPAAPGRFLELGFEPRPAYLPDEVVIPTFDDVPDPDWSRPLLDWLDASGLHADFFVNTAHRCDVATVPACAALLERILRSHNPGNHTAHHVHLGTDCRALDLGPVACEDELRGVESQIQVLSNGGITHLSRFRAPWGEPFQKGGTTLDEMQAVVARFAVHVGWSIDAGDADGESASADPAPFVDNVTRALGGGPGQGSWGIVRMSGASPWSLGAAQALLDRQTGYLATHHFRAATVEDAVCWKYGRHSWELVSQITGHRVGEN